ncbi:MAG TPA: cell envelope integrity protein TolA [Steroidobacteraceae bacterium]
MSEPRSDRWVPRVLSLVVHAIVVAVFVYGWWHFKHSAPAPRPLSIEATVVDAKAFDSVSTQRAHPAPPTPAPPKPAEPAPLEPAEPARKKPPEPTPQKPPQPSAQELLQRQHEAEKRDAAKRAAEEAAADKAAADKAAAEKAAAEKAAAEQAAVQKAREDAAKAKEAQERAASENDLRRRLAAEERLAAAQSSGLQDQWVAQIQARIQRAWIRPPSAKPGLDCTVEVVQVPGGEVVSAHVAGCNGDAAVQQSIEAAVYRASPLPAPPDPSLFVRNIEVRFKPND